MPHIDRDQAGPFLAPHWLALIVALGATILPLSLSGQPSSLPPMTTITFAPGSSTATVSGQVQPGGRTLYYVAAQAGQTMTVSLNPAAGLAFQVYRPDTTIARAADGRPLITGRTLPDAGSGDNAQAWMGAIPAAGDYLIAVGTTGAAGALFSLTVTLQ